MMNNELDINEFFHILYERVFMMIFIVVISCLIALIIALSTPNKYVSSALLASSNEGSSFSNSLGGLSNFAGIAGISLPKEPTDKSIEAMERIKSFNFFSKNFLPYIKLEDLYAAEGWNQSNNQLKYNAKLFDANSRKWVRKTDSPEKKIPSNQQAYAKYKKLMSISQDNKTNFFTLSIEHFSPYIARDWVDIIVKNINNEMRLIDQKIAMESIDFLNANSEKTNINELKEVINNLLEKQMQNLMLSSSREDYIFTIIQPAISPEEKSYPRRSLIMIIGFITGLVISILFALVMNYWKKDVT